MSPQVLRAIGAGWLLFFLLWLPFEDTHIIFALVLALDLCTWIAFRNWATWTQLDLPLALLASSMWLAMVPLFAVALMAFKSGIHGHGFADFSARQVTTTLFAIPICFVLGGVLGGLARALGRNSSGS
jgi:hypothetical protein